MRTVADIVCTLEGRGWTFWFDGLRLRFDYEDAVLEPGDSKLVGELALERESEAVEFIRRRETLERFGQYAGIFRLAVYRFRTPRGMLGWLRERCPSLYRDLDRQADRVQELWEQGAPLEEFSLAVRLLEEKHGAARGFYSACLMGGERSKR